MPTSKTTKPLKKAALKKVETKPAAKKTEAVKATAKISGISVPMFDAKGAKNGTFALPKEVFGAKINDQLMAQAVRVYLANQRQGNAHSKTRGEISLTTAKWFRQKGTGRARHGAQSAPIFVGGGVAHGPRAHDYSLSMPAKMRKAALLSALSQKAKDGEVMVVSGFTNVGEKTKFMSQVITKITDDKKRKNKLLIITSGVPKTLPNVYKAGRNIKNVDLMSANLLNTYEILKHKNLLIMKESIEVLSGGSAKQNS
jgi:large subunit ribosomal protein L4